MADVVNEETEVKGDDGLTDDERRIKKMQDKIDQDGDAERARQERANGEAPGARGRNADREESVEVAPKSAESDHDSPKESPVKATPRKAQSK